MEDSIHRPPTANSFKSPKITRDGRNSTPSISPLSSTSKAHDHSPHIDAEPITNGAKVHIAEGVDDDAHLAARDRSSSLSDIEGDFEEQDQRQEQSESDDGLTPIGGEENDSEAETERIKPTPQKENRTLKGIMNTPLDALREDVTSDNDSVGTLEDGEGSRPTPSLAGRKRKRPAPRNASSFAQSDESDSESALADRRGHKKSATDSGLRLNANGAGAEAEEPNGNEGGIDESDHLPLPDVRSPTKEHKRTKAKSHGKSHKKRIEPPAEEDTGDADDVGEVIEEEDDESADVVDPAEMAIREQALRNFQLLAEQFNNLRASIHAERIAEAEAELAQLQQAHPVHPEFIRQLQTVTLRRDTKIEQELKLHEYQKEALRNNTLANRAQLLSQYMQDARDVRERILYELGKQWYDIQKERRAMQADEVESYHVVFPRKRSVQVRQQARYNLEVSILSGMAKHVGFPAAPEISGMQSKDVDDDLKAIRAKLPLKTTPYPAKNFGPAFFGPAMPTPTTDPKSDNIAQKEFLEQTPWANPRHPVHAQSRTPSAFGHHALTNHSSPVYGMLGRQPPHYSTPQIGMDKGNNSEARPPGSNDTVGVLSDPPSSVQPAPPTADRIRLIPYEQGGDTSPTAQVKRAAVGSKRDFSGLSSASTIDAPPEGSVLGDGRTPGIAMDAMPPTRVFATSGMHGQGRESR
ncbi:hypothetical protein CAC42_3598 [Sphaceloma murrayae]|uniref:Transcriptional regulatory protein DEP1 n=1 Tax=Sphaceloma murrayae TaxID=2082308 RepID=A0A2K1QTE4_9PEZI|nr:hypothetical protein CAC42_3598 [Sphaceloma murrayae]